MGLCCMGWGCLRCRTDQQVNHSTKPALPCRVIPPISSKGQWPYRDKSGATPTAVAVLAMHGFQGFIAGRLDGRLQLRHPNLGGVVGDCVFFIVEGMGYISN